MSSKLDETLGANQWIEAELGLYQKNVAAALVYLAQQDILSRIWAHDHTVWKPEPTEIINRLGWLHAPKRMPDDIPRFQTIAHIAYEDGFRTAVVLGMGGSSLAPELFGEVFATEGGKTLRLTVLDTTDPEAIWEQARRLDLNSTLFLVSTKSGTTVETLSLFRFFYNRIASSVQTRHPGGHFIAITDPGTPLVDLAVQHTFRDIVLGDPSIGGRYSALSAFGLVPAALAGVNLWRLHTHAEVAWEMCRPEKPVEANPAALLGCILAELAKAGRDKATFVLSSALASFGDWVEQLLAESIGKEGKAIVPIVGEPLGVPGVYGNDRLFIRIYLERDQATENALEDLRQAGHPVVSICLRDLYDLGGQFFIWELATAVAGALLGINPFDQPNVEAAKALARQALAESLACGGEIVSADFTRPTVLDLLDFVSSAHEGDYIALQAYLPPRAEIDRPLHNLRVLLRDRLKVATTLGYGPRYLHSTGQMHKGDRGNGLFLQFTAEAIHDLPIPDYAGQEASSATFGALEMAQAAGDRRALEAAGRRVLHIHLGWEPARALDRLVSGLERAWGIS